jgi:uncharacterized protein (DUF2235 family)
MKNIVLCSDGTGNKGGYGADSNVYKTYKAVDIKNPGVDQYTFYDQGVGTDKSDTSKNKYRTALSGAFGFGFRDNVLHLYHFLARSYNPGDAIFLFGFSRGAATVRAFAGFINACGLIDISKHAVKPNGDFDSDRCESLVSHAFDCYKSKDKNLMQKFKDQYAIKDDIHAPNGDLKIKFVGVWDTVSALGFSQDFSFLLKWIFSAADKISNMIPWLAHDFYDYDLNNSIENAYHALSIDDERTTFHPKVWDEKAVWDEKKLNRIPFNGYVEQVWFAGVHSNVGGGYPRTGLSDVALQWMLTKAQAHGLVLYPDQITAIQDSANIYDRLYDSRDGVAIYYRYGPRNLVELCDKKLNGNIAIHLSAYKKLKELSDGYAPDGIPRNFDIIDINPTNPASATIVRQVNTVDPTWAGLETEMNKVIEKRKYVYRIFVELTMAIIVASGLFWVCPPESVMELNACEKKHVQIVQTTSLQTNELSSLIANPFFAFEQDVNSKPNSDTSPDFCKKANNRPLKWLADITRYLTPVYFENFITYVFEVHWWIFIVMLSTLFYLNSIHKRCVNRLDKVCRDMTDLLPKL